MTATQLGLLLAEAGRRHRAAPVLLDAALLWHQAADQWDPAGQRDTAQRGADLIGQRAGAHDQRHVTGASGTFLDSVDRLYVTVPFRIGPWPADRAGRLRSSSLPISAQ